MAVTGEDFVIRFGGKSDGAQKAINAVTSGAGRLASVLSNLARQAHLMLPAFAAKTAALGLMAAGFRRVRDAAIESFEPVETALVRLQQTTTMTSRSVSASLQHMFTIASSTGTQMESVIAAMGAAQRGGERGYGSLLAAQAGTSMSLVMGGDAAGWTATGAAGGERFGMSTEDYLDRVLWGHQRGMDQAAVDAQLEAGVGLQQAAGALSQAANLLAGSREFEQQRAANEWELTGQRYGAMFDAWGMGAPVRAKLSRQFAEWAGEPARELYNLDAWVREHGWVRGLWGGVMSGMESPYPDDPHVAMDGTSGAGRRYAAGPEGTVIGVGGIDKEIKRIFNRMDYLTGYEGDLTAAQEEELSGSFETLKELNARKQAIKDRRANADRQYESYVNRLLSGTERSDMVKLKDAMRQNEINAQRQATAQEQAALETEMMAAQMARSRIQATNMASGMAAAAKLVGQQSNLAAFGVMGQLDQLHQQYGEYLPAVMTVMKHKTGDQIIDTVRAMVKRQYGSGVAGLIDWEQFKTPAMSPAAPAAAAPAAVPTLYTLGGGRSPAYSVERIEAESSAIRAAGGTLLDLPAG